MKIRSVASVISIAVLALAAVSCDDDKDNSKKSCDETTVLECASENMKNVCHNGFVTAQKCDANYVCQNNACVPDSNTGKVPCDENTRLTCASENAKTKCEGGFIEEEKCGADESCSDNVCSKSERENLVGDDCTVDVCYKNIPHYCNHSTGKLYITIGESPACAEGTVCEVSDEFNAFCLKACANAGDREYVCGKNQIQLYSANALCKQFPDGKLALYVDESDVNNTEFCEDDCIDGRCTDVKPTTDGDEDCDQETYGYHCDENKLVFCNSFGKVVENDCSLLGRSCKTDSADAKNSACVDTSSECDNPGNTTYSCQEAGEEDSYDTLIIRVCTKATDNKNYLFGDSKLCDIGTCTTEGGCTDY